MYGVTLSDTHNIQIKVFKFPRKTQRFLNAGAGAYPTADSAGKLKRISNVISAIYNKLKYKNSLKNYKFKLYRILVHYKFLTSLILFKIKI